MGLEVVYFTGAAALLAAMIYGVLSYSAADRVAEDIVPTGTEETKLKQISEWQDHGRRCRQLCASLRDWLSRSAPF
jgi:hypothetical protein